MLKIGERIRMARLEKGIAQERLGEILGVKQNAVSQWETGRCEPSADMIRQIAIALDCSGDFLLDLENR